MKNQLFISILLLLVMASCEFDDTTTQYDLGNDFINDPTRIYMIDTLTVNTYTTKIDSFATSRAKRFLAGSYTNDFGIETYCETYFRINVADFSGFHASAVFDSASFILHLDGYNFGDTTNAQEFEIYRLAQDIEVNEKTEYIYNLQKFSTEATPIARFTVDLNDEEDSISVPLSKILGSQLFDLCLNDADSILENDEFYDYFKGISIKPVKGNSNFIVGIEAIPDTTTTPRIRVYYHDNTILDNLYIDFPLQDFQSETGLSTDNYYSSNHIENIYRGTELSRLTSIDSMVSSELTGNYSFLQAGLTLRTRIELPTIDDLYPYGVGAIIKAELLMEPYPGFSQASDLPSTLEMTLVDEKNRYFSPLYIVGSTSDVATGYLKFYEEFKKKTYYSYDISSYLKDEYDSKANPKYALMMNLPYSSDYPTVDQLILANQKNDQPQLKLKVYLANY